MRTGIQTGWRAALVYALSMAICVAPGIVLVGALTGCLRTASAQPYHSAEAEQHARALVAKMTLEEKIAQMQNSAPAIPRLGIPAYNWWNEGLHGIARSGYATVFPQAIGMAAAWDEELQQQIGTIAGIEARAKYNQAIREGNHSIYFGLTFWSPNINIFRDPRWGRGQETYGEDPFLTARLGTAYVRGLQGAVPDAPMVIATPKHYAVHSGPEPLRHGFDVTPSPKDLEETYLPAFRAAITEGHADSLMCAYNAVDGVPACASQMLLQQTLRQDWGFSGFVTSDCGAIRDISSATGHHFAPDEEHAAALAVKAGTDTTCGNEYIHLGEAVRDGLITEAEIDRAAVRLFTARYLLGMMDDESKDARAAVPIAANDSAAHRAMALKDARESIVLLRNEGSLLPLGSGLKRLAVIGPNAASIDVLEGNYNGVPSHPVVPLDGLEAALRGRAQVVYAEGAPLVDGMPVVAPRTLFRPAAAAGSRDAGGMGLKAEYFDGAGFTGTPVLTRTDPQIDFDWNAARPVPGLSRDAYAVRWSGTITAPAAGDIAFSIRTPHCSPCGDTEQFRVYLDGQVVNDQTLERAGRSRGSVQPFTLHFTDTRAHAFRMEYMHRSPLFGGGLTLTWQPPLGPLRAEAVNAAKRADAVVAFVGLSPELEGEEMHVDLPGFNGGDRTSVDLPAAQADLLDAVAATGKPLVVVLMSGSAVSLASLHTQPGAVLEAWYPGEAGGEAIADVLLGRYSPAGRLPVTFYASTDQLPPFTDYRMKQRTYRYFTGRPLFPFGFGLSYTRFAYSGRRLSATEVDAGQPLTASATVRNTGRRESDEVVELYLAAPVGGGSPRHSLVGFHRIHLKAGEQREVSFTLTPRELSTVGEDGTRAVRAGRYTLFLGGGQPGDNDPDGLALTIRGTEPLPR